jgi:hypothetical protein
MRLQNVVAAVVLCDFLDEIVSSDKNILIVRTRPRAPVSALQRKGVGGTCANASEARSVLRRV